MPEPCAVDRELFVLVSPSSDPEAVRTPGEKRPAGQTLCIFPPPFLFLLLFRSQTLEPSRRKATSRNTMATQALGDAVERGFSLKQRHWPASPIRTPQRPGSVHLQWAAHTAKPECRTLICKGETLPISSGSVFSASGLVSDSSCFFPYEAFVAPDGCVLCRRIFILSPEIVRVDLGHCLSTVDPVVHWEEGLVSKEHKFY